MSICYVLGLIYAQKSHSEKEQLAVTVILHPEIFRLQTLSPVLAGFLYSYTFHEMPRPSVQAHLHGLLNSWHLSNGALPHSMFYLLTPPSFYGIFNMQGITKQIGAVSGLKLLVAAQALLFCPYAGSNQANKRNYNANYVLQYSLPHRHTPFSGGLYPPFS